MRALCAGVVAGSLLFATAAEASVNPHTLLQKDEVAYLGLEWIEPSMYFEWQGISFHMTAYEACYESQQIYRAYTPVIRMLLNYLEPFSQLLNWAALSDLYRLDRILQDMRAMCE